MSTDTGAILGLVLFVIMLGAACWWYAYDERKKERFVCVGDIWEDAKTHESYEVVEANPDSITGPDSWKMRNIMTLGTLYMHHRARLQGEWRLLYRGTWHSRRAEELFGPAAGV